MMFKRREIRKFTTLDNIYKLTVADNILFTSIKNNTFNEQDFFANLNKNCNLDFVIRLAHGSDFFEKLFKNTDYQKLWELQYSLIGHKLSYPENKSINFFVHENANSFDLLRAAYFFHQSQRARLEVCQDFLYSEISLLKEAIKFKSAHAVQRYNCYLYEQANIAHETDPTGKESERLLSQAITNCKKLLELYGSYAYMMLAEAYFNYAQWAQKEQKIKLSKQVIDAAIRACTLADQYLEKSRFSIYNASLGKGLAASNSFSIEKPQQAKEMLQNWIVEPAPIPSFQYS